MTTRGIRRPGVEAVTIRMLGCFRDDPATRREFLSVIGSQRNAPHRLDHADATASALFAATTVIALGSLALSRRFPETLGFE